MTPRERQLRHNIALLEERLASGRIRHPQDLYANEVALTQAQIDLEVLTLKFAAPKPRDPFAASLAAPQFRPKTVADKRRRTGRKAKHKGGAE